MQRLSIATATSIIIVSALAQQANAGSVNITYPTSSDHLVEGGSCNVAGTLTGFPISGDGAPASVKIYISEVGNISNREVATGGVSGPSSSMDFSFDVSCQVPVNLTDPKKVNVLVEVLNSKQETIDSGEVTNVNVDNF